MKVNFPKSYTVGVNVCPRFLAMAEGFLQCKIGTVLFNYFGAPGGGKSEEVSQLGSVGGCFV